MAAGCSWLGLGVVLFLTAPINCSRVQVTLSCVPPPPPSLEDVPQLSTSANLEFIPNLSGSTALSPSTKPHLKFSYQTHAYLGRVA